MPEPRAKIRLFVADALGPGAVVQPGPAQAHYLGTVMRLAPGARVALFNGRDGEWAAELAVAGRRLTLTCAGQSAPQVLPPDLWLLFAPIKKARTDFIVEKAAELGVRRILPVLTRYTQAERVNSARLRAHAVEAAEQCGGVFVPDIAAPAPLTAVLADWEPGRALVFCDERGGPPLGRGTAPAPAAILIGPEGGFAPDEAAAIRARPFARACGLGPRILRADTAAVAALALWQAMAGDWTPVPVADTAGGGAAAGVTGAAGRAVATLPADGTRDGTGNGTDPGAGGGADATTRGGPGGPAGGVAGVRR